MISATEMVNLLMTADRLNLGTVKAGQAELWAEVLNQELPAATADQVRRAILKLAATRATELRGVFLTPGDLIVAVKGVSEADRRDRHERLVAAKHKHGDFTVHEAVTDPGEFLRFKQVTQAAFLDGATVEQAQAAGFAALGRPVPVPELPAEGAPSLAVPEFQTTRKAVA